MQEAGLAKALRELRHEHGWTLADVSERTDIPVSTLSKVENNKLSLTYDKLVRISHGLNVDITRLFQTNEQADTQPSKSFYNRRSIDRAGGGHHIKTPAYDHQFLATDLLSKKLDPIIATLQARSMDEFGEWVRHSGEEFTYVLEGEVLFCSEIYSPVLLKQGDSVYFDSNMGHAYLAATEGPCKVISVCTCETEGEIEDLREIMKSDQ